MRYVLGPAVHDLYGGLTVRIAEDARRCVVFFGIPSPPNGDIAYGGTGFIASLPHDGIRSQYLITCRHVAKALESHPEFILRINRVDGGAEDAPVDDAEWVYHPDPTVDLAAMHFYVPKGEYDIISYALEGTTDRAENKIRCGDPINIVGLFRLHSETHRNTPIVHSGHIALLSDPVERVPIIDRTTGERMETEAYLVEAQTLEGLSGSPVYVHHVVSLPAFTEKDGFKAQVFGSLILLGLYQGAWDALAGDLIAKDRNWKGGVRVPVGMGLVVPFAKIMELLDHPMFKDVREKRVDHYRKGSAATTDSGFPASAAPPPAPDNPHHKEDFTALLNAAVKKPKQDD